MKKIILKFSWVYIIISTACCTLANASIVNNGKPIASSEPLFTPVNKYLEHNSNSINKTDKYLNQKVDSLFQSTSHSNVDNIIDVDENMLLANYEILATLLSESIKSNDIEGIDILLPVYEKLERKHQDKILLNFAHAKLALNRHHYEDATKRLRYLIAVKPDVINIRMYLAIALFYNREYEAAKGQFEKVLSSKDTQTDMVVLSNQFLEVIAKQYSWKFDTSINYIHDPNVNNAPITKNKNNLTTNDEESANGLSYSLSASKEWALQGQTAHRLDENSNNNLSSGSWSIPTKLDLSGKHYFGDYSSLGDLSSTLSTGIVYKTASTEWRIEPFLGKRWWKGGETESLAPYSKQYGITVQLNKNIDHNWQYLGYARLENQKHIDRRKHFDGNRYALSNTVVYQKNPSQSWFAGTTLNKETLKSEDDSNHGENYFIGWTQDWSSGISTRNQLSYYETHYEAPTFTFPVREDTGMKWQSSLWHRGVHIKGFTPRITFETQRNKSNVFLYDYKKNKVFFELSKTF